MHEAGLENIGEMYAVTEILNTEVAKSAGIG